MPSFQDNTTTIGCIGQGLSLYLLDFVPTAGRYVAFHEGAGIVSGDLMQVDTDYSRVFEKV